jgi:RNA polymerase sigma factor (TIGR02999 family)
MLGFMSEMPRHRSDDAVPIVYEELRRLAADHLANEPAGQTLSPTSLVHEAYLRLAAADHWESPRHFYNAAALAMRHILIDRVRARRADKRGGGRTRVALDVAEPATDPVVDYLDLDAALTGLAAEDELAAELIQLRFFAGLTRDAAAELLEISPRQADRVWAFGKAWLYQRLRV